MDTKVIVAGGLLLTLGMSLIAAHAEPADTQPGVDYIRHANHLSAQDEHDMTRIIVQLNHALDAEDYELYASFFAEEAEFVSGFGVAKGRDEIAAALEASRPFIRNKRHVSGNILFSGDNQNAVATSYLIVFEREVSVSYVGSAVGTDFFEKRNGEWTLVRHESVLDQSTADAMAKLMGGNQ